MLANGPWMTYGSEIVSIWQPMWAQQAILGGAASMGRREVWLAVLLVAGLLVVLLGSLVAIPRLLYPPLTAADLRDLTNTETRVQLQQTQAELQNNARSDVLQGLAGLLLVVGSVATWRQVQVGREGQITERFTRAIEQVGSDNIDVRLGGIYALERIAKNSPADAPTVQYVLGAFVRGHAPWQVGSAQVPEHPTPTLDERVPWLYARAPDIQAAMNVLGRRRVPPGTMPLYLSRTDLRRVRLHEAQLADTRCRYANLARAWMRGTRLDGSDLKGTDLREAVAVGASFAGAILDGAYLQGADLSGADLRGADMRAVGLEHAVLIGARANANTVWPSGLDAARRRELGVVEAG